MQFRDGTILFSPSDLVTYMTSSFASHMERQMLDDPGLKDLVDPDDPSLGGRDGAVLFRERAAGQDDRGVAGGLGHERVDDDHVLDGLEAPSDPRTVRSRHRGVGRHHEHALDGTAFGVVQQLDVGPTATGQMGEDIDPESGRTPPSALASRG